MRFKLGQFEIYAVWITVWRIDKKCVLSFGTRWHSVAARARLNGCCPLEILGMKRRLAKMIDMQSGVGCSSRRGYWSWWDWLCNRCQHQSSGLYSGRSPCPSKHWKLKQVIDRSQLRIGLGLLVRDERVVALVRLQYWHWLAGWLHQLILLLCSVGTSF